MKELVRFKIPIPRGKAGSLPRGKYDEWGDLIPDLVNGNRIEDGRRFRVDITFNVSDKFLNDIDNMAKKVLDMLKGRVIPDDRQVYILHIEKKHGGFGTDVLVSEIL